MVAYNFQARFADAVERGEKRQTIRRKRANGHAKPGDIVQLYTGMRTSACRKLADAVCEVSTYCAIREDGITLGNHPRVDLDDFACADGFEGFEDMKNWFRDMYGLPFIGHLVRWSTDSTKEGQADG